MEVSCVFFLPLQLALCWSPRGAGWSSCSASVPISPSPSPTGSPRGTVVSSCLPTNEFSNFSGRRISVYWRSKFWLAVFSLQGWNKTKLEREKELLKSLNHSWLSGGWGSWGNPSYSKWSVSLPSYLLICLLLLCMTQFPDCSENNSFLIQKSSVLLSLAASRWESRVFSTDYTKRLRKKIVIFDLSSEDFILK